MRNIRIAALAIVAASVVYYVWVGLSGGWDSGAIAIPIVAGVIASFAFPMSGEGIAAALTGRNSKEFRTGLIGIGTVTGVAPTGMTLNDQPQLRIQMSVEGADGKVFASTAKMIVPVTEAALLRPGVVLPVRYLPDRTDKVEIDLTGSMEQFQAAYDQVMIRRGVTTAGKLDIAKRGVAAQAVVQAVSVTGEIRDGHSQLDITLAVTRPDGSRFVTRAEKFIPPANVAHVQVGRIVDVHYLPGAEDDVVLSLPLNHA